MFDGPARHARIRVREGIERLFISDINNPAASNMAQDDLAIMQDEANSEIMFISGSERRCRGWRGASE